MIKKGVKSGILGGLTLLMAALCAISALGGTANANSAYWGWRGVLSSGAVVTDVDCPVVVEKELLTFNISEFPLPSYGEEDAAALAAYKAGVTARYSFYNPADYAVDMTLVFPFGALPEYAYDAAQGLDFGALGYGATVNGETAQGRVRHTYADVPAFTLSDISRISDGLREDGFYSADAPVTKYAYALSETNGYLRYTVRCGSAGDNTRLIYCLRNADGTVADSYNISGGSSFWIWVKGGMSVEIYAVGSDLSVIPQWSVQDDGDSELTAAQYVTYEGKEYSEFYDFALTCYDADSGVSETDWYNAVVDSLNDFGKLDVKYKLMRWYEYSLSLGAGERAVNEVSVPVYPSIWSGYEPSVYNYEYYLSPASCWADFGSLEIVINTPYFIVDEESPFVATESGYRAVFDGLPSGELTFSLCEVQNPRSTAGRVVTVAAIVAAVVVGLVVICGVIAVVVIAVIFSKKKKRALAGSREKSDGGEGESG